ncbi:branched-chain amino acid transport system II carrier protein [Ruoffia tabacinasalis]|uniref:Branched-chain amino acid transport system carrier protein n=1 Tax=Ruoffia tabacinasalis TaxID=87458 RepID=A0ABS0LJ24_9LACT|nr:branched-chain amino acid transport system II carrier protein [Ruoffia tabacinasalis]MBG9978154.1 branched-chain amino acid transport system II carrier protein [Ruoffia tabacinasalis]
MKQPKFKLTFKEILVVASLLFGLFFGAGNIIFPVSLGQSSGGNVWPAILGFNITAVGLPLLAVISMGLSQSESVIDMTQKISKKYSYFFTVALYLTIGPFFATPRLATVSYEVGLSTLIPQEFGAMSLFIYSFIFYLIVLYFSLRPSGILDWIGRYLNPLFLVLLTVILIRAFTSGDPLIGGEASVESYQNTPFSTGLIEGYNTMDGLAGLAFGIIIIKSIRNIGVTEPKRLASQTVKSGVLSLAVMALIYLCLALLGTQSLNFTDVAPNGGVAMSIVTQHYFGLFGQILLAGVMAVACLKTAIGLVVALAETFADLFPQFLSQRVWTFIATIISFLVANIGLNLIISYSLPVLMLLYPLAITLILLHLFEPIVKSRAIYRSVTFFTMIAALFDMIAALPQPLYQWLQGDMLGSFAKSFLPFYSIGFGWVVPALIGFVVGLILTKVHPEPAN